MTFAILLLDYIQLSSRSSSDSSSSATTAFLALGLGAGATGSSSSSSSDARTGFASALGGLTVYVSSSSLSSAVAGSTLIGWNLKILFRS